VFWVISVYFNIRNTLPKSGTFLQGHPVNSIQQYIAHVVENPSLNRPRIKQVYKFKNRDRQMVEEERHVTVFV
jgi:hypothetical protein